MPSLLQFATLFNVIAAALVVGLSLLKQRLRPIPVFRLWILTYAWGALTTAIVSTESLMTPGLVTVAAAYGALTLSVWYTCRLGCTLLERPLLAWPVRGALALMAIVGVGTFCAGYGYQMALLPGPIAIVGAFVWLGAVMIRVGRTPAYAGMGWIGAPVVVQGLWLLTYPVTQRWGVHWLGYGVAALLDIGVGLGMVMFVLLSTTRQLERQNQALLAAEQALRQVHAEREQLQREFLGAASHELRAPITSVLGYSELLADGLGGALGPLQAQYVRAIQKGVRRMRRLVDDMLDFAAMESGACVLAPQAIDVAAIVADEIAAFEPMAKEQEVSLALVLTAGPVPAQADPGRVGQVLANLIGNALKYTRPGGRVQVEVLAAPDQVRVAVRDDGIGVAAEHLPHLFEKHFRVDAGASRALGGSGLGLAICRALVEAQGGQIGVESAPGQGSTFWFTLPADKGR